VAKNHVLLHGTLIEMDDATGKAIKIRRVAEALNSLRGEVIGSMIDLISVFHLYSLRG